LSWIVSVTLLHFTELTPLVFCSSSKPAEGGGQAGAAVLEPVGNLREEDMRFHCARRKRIKAN
jgi:hypothetical protein